MSKKVKWSKKRKVITFTSIGLVSFILLSGVLSVYFCYLHRYLGTEKIYEWNKTDEFNIESIATIEKQEGKPFTILNFADIQMCDLEDFFNRPTIHRELDYLVETVKPDLITLTGDQTWSNENLMSLKSLISWLESYKIPYAPIFGNHDYGNDYNSSVATLNYCCDLYENSEYCLFDRGPSNLGALGNYVINITENGKIIKTLYMLDAGYNTVITKKQIEWVKWNADGIKENNDGEYSEGMCFMHKPLPEHREAYYSYFHGESQAIGEVYNYCSLWGLSQTGFFEMAKEINVKDIICGHQHTNNFTIFYQGIRMTFALKTGELSFYYCDENINLNGGTVIKIDDETSIYSEFVKEEDFHIDGSDNIYN